MHAFLREEINAKRFLGGQDCCQVFHRRPYYSRDRRANIIFDVAIECCLPGQETPSLIWLFECKDYGRAVAVDDVEEFFAKVQQVAAANGKAVMVTTGAYQRGALEFAAAKGIGLVRLFPTGNWKWELLRSPSSMSMSRALSRESEIFKGLTEESYQSPRFDWYCNTGTVFTYSAHDFLMALCGDKLDANTLAAIAPALQEGDLVPFITPEEIEMRSAAVLAMIGYQEGAVALEAICESQRNELGLTVTTGVRPTEAERRGGILGRIAFAPPTIIIFADPLERHRSRFTLAHELGHLLLGHGAYLHAESVDGNDLEQRQGGSLADDDIRRLEWQANSFASCLLLPFDAFGKRTFEVAVELGLKDKGFGLLYLDEQPVNRRAYYTLTSALMEIFAVSRTAVTIRLKALGLLREAGTQRPTLAG